MRLPIKVKKETTEPRKLLLKVKSDAHIKKMASDAVNIAYNVEFPDVTEKEIKGNIWDFIGKCSMICIPTNGYVKPNGEATLGAGLAKEMLQICSKRDPRFAKKVGWTIEAFGNRAHIVDMIDGTYIQTFPTKPGYIIVNDDKSNIISSKRYMVKPEQMLPGYFAKSDLELIKRSAYTTLVFANATRDSVKRVIIPKVGCGFGELDWGDVKEALTDVGLYQAGSVQFIEYESKRKVTL